MRPSSAASVRASHFGSSVSSATRLLEKRKEYEAVKALDKISAELVERLEALGDDCEIMAEAGQIFGSVMDHWARMFGIISLVSTSRQLLVHKTCSILNNTLYQASSQESTDNNEENTDDQAPPKAEKLVRLEIASLEQVPGGK